MFELKRFLHAQTSSLSGMLLLNNMVLLVRKRGLTDNNSIRLRYINFVLVLALVTLIRIKQ